MELFLKGIESCGNVICDSGCFLFGKPASSDSETSAKRLPTADCTMDIKLDPSRDDLPLMANTSHILVKHYILDLDVDFGSRVFEGTIVLFFGDGNHFKKQTSSTQETFQMESEETYTFRTAEPCHVPEMDASTFSPKMGYRESAVCGKGDQDAFGGDGNHDNQEHDSEISSSKYCCDTGNHGKEDFLLVLDCCDLSVLKVEEVDVASVPGLERFTKASKLAATPEKLRHEIVRDLMALPADGWREQLDCYTRCSKAPGCGELLFDTDNWSIQIRKMGVRTAADFPRAIRIQYKTKPEGQSVTWTSDQSGRVHELVLLHDHANAGLHLHHCSGVLERNKAQDIPIH